MPIKIVGVAEFLRYILFKSNIISENLFNTETSLTNKELDKTLKLPFSFNLNNSLGNYFSMPDELDDSVSVSIE
jgi:hypothetical protein